MAKKNKPPGKKYNYMDTYGDLVTLLLCFFVLLFSMSSLDETQFSVITEALGQQFGNRVMNDSTVVHYVPNVTDDFGSDPTDGEVTMPSGAEHEAAMNDLADDLQAHIIENNLQGDVELQRGDNGLVFVRLSNNLLFAGNSFDLQPRSIELLNYLGEHLKGVENDIYTVNCVGHTAEVPDSPADDWILSGERAGIVASYLDSQIGFPATKLQVTAYGRMYPVADNSDIVARAANRRVDIVIINNSPEHLAEALLEASLVYFPDDDKQYFKGDTDRASENDTRNANSYVPPSTMVSD